MKLEYVKKRHKLMVLTKKKIGKRYKSKWQLFLLNRKISENGMSPFFIFMDIEGIKIKNKLCRDDFTLARVRWIG